jgi:hypothetical protein
MVASRLRSEIRRLIAPYVIVTFHDRMLLQAHVIAVLAVRFYACGCQLAGLNPTSTETR